MTTEEQYARIIEQNDEAAKQYAEECARAEAHRQVIRTELSTLRDDFAKAALTGLLASGTNATTDRLAFEAYVIAAAMLAERAK